MRARRGRLPRLDARRRPPVHDPPAPARGQLGRRRSTRRARRRRRLRNLGPSCGARPARPPDAPPPRRARLPPDRWDEALDAVAGRPSAPPGRPHGALPDQPGHSPTRCTTARQGGPGDGASPASTRPPRVCHAPSTVGLKQTIGVAATTCSMQDVIESDLIVLWGTNVANNQPVFMKYLYLARKRGARSSSSTRTSSRGSSATGCRRTSSRRCSARSSATSTSGRPGGRRRPRQRRAPSA